MSTSVKLTADMQRILNEQRLGFVASVCEDGTPNLSPKGTTTVWDDEHIVFADICSPGTIANLRHHPVVEINVVDPVSRKGYRFKGPATISQHGPIFEQGLAFFRQRGTRSPIHSIVLVRVERAIPLISPAYDQGKGEEEIRASWLQYWTALYWRPEDLGKQVADAEIEQI
jgi:predicted pyridoxine 5'-phosphate oxidase superfamily flavin-nucleotide-binding protein